MKKRVIALSIAAAMGGFAGTASAQNTDDLVISARSSGHILYTPYFSTQGGNATLINIVNTDEVNGKAVKIRFRGASNSDDVFDFQLFLSPGDVWAAGITQNASGLSQLTTIDKSCTLPASVNGSFITGRLNSKLTGDALANETREGYIEIFNMGDIVPTLPAQTTANALYTAIKHTTAGTAPCTTATLEGLARFDSKISLPTRGLMGNWTIINVPQTTTWTGDMTTIVAINSTSGLPGTGRQVYFPQTAAALSPSDVLSFTADPLFQGATPIVAGASYDLPDLSTPYATGGFGVNPQSQANLLSHAVASQNLAGEYLTDPGIVASTDWIVSIPTRRYYAAVDYSGTTPALVTNYDTFTNDSAIYFRRKGGRDGTNGNVVLRGFQACVTLSAVKFYNREEQTPQSSGIVISPGVPAPAPELCGEVSALSINAGGSVGPSPTIKASVARANIDLPSGFRDGWGLVSVPNNFTVASGLFPLAPGNYNLGLPNITAQFVRAVNGAASPGVSGTYAARWSARTLNSGNDPFVTSVPIAQ